MTSRRSFYKLAVAAVTASVLGWAAPAPAAAPTQEQLQQIAAKFVAELARSCPHKPNMDYAAFQSCTAKLTQSTEIPFASAVLWGGDQANLRMKDRHLTKFNAEVFRGMYLPLMSFTGKPAAAIVYRREKHVINLFAFVADDHSDAAPRLDTRDGFNVVRWRMGGLSYVAVSDVEAAQLLAFVHLVESG